MIIGRLDRALFVRPLSTTSGPASFKRDADYSTCDCSIACSFSTFGVAGIVSADPVDMKCGDKRVAADDLGRSRSLNT